MNFALLAKEGDTELEIFCETDLADLFRQLQEYLQERHSSHSPEVAVTGVCGQPNFCRIYF